MWVLSVTVLGGSHLYGPSLVRTSWMMVGFMLWKTVLIPQELGVLSRKQRGEGRDICKHGRAAFQHHSFSSFLLPKGRGGYVYDGLKTQRWAHSRRWVVWNFPEKIASSMCRFIHFNYWDSCILWVLRLYSGVTWSRWVWLVLRFPEDLFLLQLDTLESLF